MRIYNKKKKPRIVTAGIYGCNEQARVVCMRLWGDLSQQWTRSSIESIIIIIWVGGAVVAAFDF